MKTIWIYLRNTFDLLSLNTEESDRNSNRKCEGSNVGMYRARITSYGNKLIYKIAWELYPFSIFRLMIQGIDITIAKFRKRWKDRVVMIVNFAKPCD